MRIAVVGATGLVGQMMIRLLEDRNFPVTDFFPVASNTSIGREVFFRGNSYSVVSAEEAILKKPQIALFSAGGAASLELAPKFADAGCVVIDNSSAWRMDPSKKLIVPEVNAASLSSQDRIIANPNCSTIQLVMVLKPLMDEFGIDSVVVSTYQSVSGTGQKGLAQLEHEEKGGHILSAYPHPIFHNLIPHIDSFTENGFTKEEMKMVLETNKILNNPEVKVTPTCVRVPVPNCHSESVYVVLQRRARMDEFREVLGAMPGVIVLDDPRQSVYPQPLFNAGSDAVFVGRIRKDLHHPFAFNCWIVSDNLRKGAATNAVQIAEYWLKNLCA